MSVTVNYLLSWTVSETWRIIGPIFAFDGVVPLFNALVRVNPQLTTTKFVLKKAETSLYCAAWKMFRYLEPFRCGSPLWVPCRSCLRVVCCHVFMKLFLWSNKMMMMMIMSVTDGHTDSRWSLSAHETVFFWSGNITSSARRLMTHEDSWLTGGDKIYGLCIPLSPSSIIWCWPEGGDALRQGNRGSNVSLPPGLWLIAPV